MFQSAVYGYRVEAYGPYGPAPGARATCLRKKRRLDGLRAHLKRVYTVAFNLRGEHPGMDDAPYHGRAWHLQGPTRRGSIEPGPTELLLGLFTQNSKKWCNTNKCIALSPPSTNLNRIIIQLLGLHTHPTHPTPPNSPANKGKGETPLSSDAPNTTHPSPPSLNPDPNLKYPFQYQPKSQS